MTTRTAVAQSNRVETDRERTARTLVCPHCDAQAGRPCRDLGGSRQAYWTAHSARYRAAVAAGLLPPLAYLEASP